ncbi:hypothetical protein BH09ACT7_BH09ACT7_01790 [soil metagenome]
MPSQTITKRVHASSFGDRRRRVVRPFVTHVSTIGQSYEIDLSREDGRWVIRIPEIGAETHTIRRTAVGVAARECIAAHTGIPIGYIAVRVRD